MPDADALRRLLERLAQAFDREEDRGAVLTQVNVCKASFRLIEGHRDFRRTDPMRGTMWGAIVVVDPDLEPTEVVLRYQRRVEKPGKSFSDWPEKRFVKRVRMPSMAQLGA